MIKINRVNQSYGRLKVVSLLYETTAAIYWKCTCSCGKDITIREAELLRGVTSCGCLGVEQQKLKEAQKVNDTRDFEAIRYTSGKPSDNLLKNLSEEKLPEIPFKLLKFKDIKPTSYESAVLALIYCLLVLYVTRLF